MLTVPVLVMRMVKLMSAPTVTGKGVLSCLTISICGKAVLLKPKS